MSNRESGTRGVRADERGVSTTLGYSLTLAITAILVTGLLMAGGALVEDQRERIAEEELSVAGEQLASGIGDADRLAGTVTDGVLQTTVWLPDRIAGAAYTIELQNHTTGANQPSRATIIAASQAVDVTAEVSVRTSVPVANRTVVGGPVVISHRDADDDGSRELVVNDSTAIGPEEPEPAVMSHQELVYVDADTGELASVARNGTVTTYGVNASAVGPKQLDLDGDGLREIPYVDSANRLRLVDAEGEVQTLATNAANSPVQNSYGTVVAIAEWRNQRSLLYMNTSDLGPNDEATIYRVGVDGDARKVTVNGTGVEANAVVGAGDVNDDGDADLVFVGLSQRIRYADDNETVDTGQTVGADEGIGVGAPRVFNASGVARIPFVASNNVRLLDDAGGNTTVTDLTTDDSAESTFVTGIDWVNDDRLEVVYIDQSSGTLRYVTLDGSTGTITDSDGDAITVDVSVGTA